MQSVLALHEHLKTTDDFYLKYPHFVTHDQKIHLLYVHPRLHEQEYYSAIAPAFELNKTKTHSVIITAIESEGTRFSIRDYMQTIDNRLILWADYIIFPTLNFPVDYMLDGLKLINPKLQTVMLLNHAYYKASCSHRDNLEIVLQNCTCMDMVTLQDEYLVAKLSYQISEAYPDNECVISYAPLFISRLAFECTNKISPKKQGCCRIGIFGANRQHIPWIKAVSKSMDNIEILLIKCQEPMDHWMDMIDIPMRIIQSVPFEDYFNTLKLLNLDMALLPDQEIYNCQAINTYLELLALGIPVIVSSKLSYVSIVIASKAGLIATDMKDWQNHIATLYHNPDDVLAIKKRGIKILWARYSFNREIYTVYRSLFS